MVASSLNVRMVDSSSQKLLQSYSSYYQLISLIAAIEFIQIITMKLLSLFNTMIKQVGKKQNEVQEVFVVCLNPNCSASSQRCLDGRTIRSHPSDCSKYYYPTDTITSTSWDQIKDYPGDSLGVSVLKKIKGSAKQTYFERIIANFRQKIETIITGFTVSFQKTYPLNALEEKYEQIYRLDRVSESLLKKQNPQYITKIINNNFSKDKYNELFTLNENFNKISESIDVICAGVKRSLKETLAQACEGEDMKKALPENFDKKIEFGLMRSKYIGSSKIECVNGVVRFPIIKNVASFLPWVYSDKSFSVGVHEIRVSSSKFPTVPNSGFLVLEEHDIDTYPYTYFKSLFSKEGKGFQLVEGSQIENFIQQTTVIILRLEISHRPQAIIMDSEMRCKYVCELQEKRNYRLGLYGSGWAFKSISMF